MLNFWRSKLFFPAIGIIIIALGFWWWRGRADSKTPPNQPNTYTVTYHDLSSNLDLSGHLTFAKEANLRFQTSGLLTWVGVKPGQKVKKGQAIASLDRRALYKQLKKALNSYYKTRLDFEDTQDEYRDILDKTPQIQRLLEKSQKDLDNAVLDVELKHLAWQLAVIHAPFDGIIDSLTVPLSGVNITPSQATFHLVDPNSLFFQAEIDELDLPRIKLGDKVTIRLDAYPNTPLQGRIDFVSFSPATGRGGSQVYLAKIKIVPDDNLKQILDSHLVVSGLNGQARLVLDKRSHVLAVPVDMVYYQDNKPYVWLQTAQGKNVKRFIQTGLETDDFIEVTSGLQPNDVVVKK